MSKKLTIEAAELLATQLRAKLGVSLQEPVGMKTIIRHLNILTIYRPLSEKLFGLSLQSCDGGEKFMLVNSNSTRGRQHFTIAHELYHLFYDENPKPHFCMGDKTRNVTERNADMFASAFLMPKDGILKEISSEEIVSENISLDTALRLEQLYGVSHTTMVLRLKDIKVISQKQADILTNVSVRKEAALRGIDLSLYQKGNENLVIGDFGLKARKLYDDEKISEGHYMELLNMIGYGENKDCTGC